MKYILPFKLRPVKIGQGFHGKSHRDWKEDKEDFSFSIDFLLPEGTEIIAARDGLVTKVKTNGEKNYNGKDPALGETAYKEWMNEIEIRHQDGTFASYCHLQKNGSFVKVGDSVKSGEVIGLSGNTGWSSAPHLDFTVSKKEFKGYKTKSIKISFEDYNGPLENSEINP